MFLRYIVIIVVISCGSISAYSMKKVPSLDSILGENNIILKTYKWVDRTFNSYDTAYIAGTGKYFNARIKNEDWIDAYSLDLPSNNRINIASDMVFHVGASIGYRAVSVSYMIDVKNAFKPNSPSRNRTNFSFASSRVVFNAYYFKNNSKGKIVRFGDLKKQKVTYDFDGVEAESYGAEINYIFNHQKYSYAAAFGFSRIQKKSAGSFFTGFTLSTHDFNFDFSGLPDNLKAQIPGSIPNLKFRYNDYGFIFGYGYNWALGKRWLVGTLLLPSLGWKHTDLSSVVGSKDVFSVNASLKISAVYNISRYFVGFLGQYSTNWFSSDKYSLVDIVGTLNLSAGIRF